MSSGQAVTQFEYRWHPHGNTGALGQDGLYSHLSLTALLLRHSVKQGWSTTEIRDVLRR